MAIALIVEDDPAFASLLSRILQEDAIPEETCTIVVTVFGGEPEVIDAMARGADAYLLKDDPSLGQSIVAALDGEAPLSPAVATHLLSSWRRLTCV